MKYPELLTRSKVIHLPEDPGHEYYLPGYLLQKIAFLMFTGFIVLIALVDIAPKLWIMATGEFIRAEVVAVLRSDADGTVEVFDNDALAKTSYEESDRIPVFHNRLAFRLPTGSTHETIMPRGSRLKPPFDILDSSGLPSTTVIAVRPDAPDRIVLPLSMSTWFFPCTILAFGLAGAIVAILYIRTATLPIQVPHLHTPPGDNLADTEEDDGQPDMEVKKKAS
jgi:hypothetical protein